jgi:hypothetical protein
MLYHYTKGFFCVNQTQAPILEVLKYNYKKLRQAYMKRHIKNGSIYETCLVNLVYKLASKDSYRGSNDKGGHMPGGYEVS